MGLMRKLLQAFDLKLTLLPFIAPGRIKPTDKGSTLTSWSPRICDSIA